MVANADRMNCSRDDVMCQTIQNMAKSAQTNTAPQPGKSKLRDQLTVKV